MTQSNLRSCSQNERSIKIVEEIEKNGYCHINGVISAAVVNRLKARLNKLASQDYYHGKVHKVMVLNPEEDEIRMLCKEDTILKNVGDYLGNSFRVSMIEGTCSVQESHKKINISDNFSSETFLGWHRDGGILNEHYDTNLNDKKLSIKCAVWLSEVKADGGNLVLLEQSHRDYHKQKEDFNLKVITAKPGDITLFDRRILHTRTPNFLSKKRMAIFIEYSLKWIKRKQKIDFNLTDNEIDIALFSNEQKGWELYKQDDY